MKLDVAGELLVSDAVGVWEEVLDLCVRRELGAGGDVLYYTPPVVV